VWRQRSVIGDTNVIDGPWGGRQLVYADYTASGRALSFIEEYLRSQVLPLYGNTHSSNSITALQTTLYRHEARLIVQRSVNGPFDR